MTNKNQKTEFVATIKVIRSSVREARKLYDFGTIKGDKITLSRIVSKISQNVLRTEDIVS